MIKKFILAITAVAIFSTNGIAAESAGLIGFVNTDRTVKSEGNLSEPGSIWTVYIAGDPSEKAVFLAYVAYKKTGQHSASIEWFDNKDSPLDRCEFDPINVTAPPHIHTISCGWGGRQPAGGITVRIFDTVGGKKEKIGEMYIPQKINK